jgi:hypothetical protein
MIGLLRLDIRLDAGQLVIRWGSNAPAAGPLPSPVARPDHHETRDADEANRIEALEGRYHTISQLVHAVADNLQAIDRRQHEEIGEVGKRLDAIQQVDRERWSDVIRVVNSRESASQKGGF